VFDPDRSFDDTFTFTENGSDDRLYLSIPFGTSIVFLESYDNSMTRIPDEELISDAEETILKYRGSMNGLEMERVVASSSSATNGDNVTFFGYYSFSVTYRQSIDGVEIGNNSGYVTVFFNATGVLRMYEDRTINVMDIEETEDHIISPWEALDRFSMSRNEEESYTLKNMSLVYSVKKDLNIASLHYELHLVDTDPHHQGMEIVFIEA
jgi:hypothetical protein